MRPASPEALTAQRILSFRRRRDALLGCEMFGEPAWQMLLNLFVLHETGGSITSEELAEASGVSKPAALRWISALESAGRVLLEEGRLRLSDDMVKALRGVLSSSAEAALPFVGRSRIEPG